MYNPGQRLFQNDRLRYSGDAMTVAPIGAHQGLIDPGHAGYRYEVPLYPARWARRKGKPVGSEAPARAKPKAARRREIAIPSHVSLSPDAAVVLQSVH